MDIPAQQNPSAPASSPSPRSGINGIVSMKNLLRSLGTLVVFLVGLGIGISQGSGQADKLLKGSGAAKESTILSNAVFSGGNVSGKLKSKSADSIVLEKDGQELMIYTDKNTIVFRLPALGDAGNTTGDLKLSDVNAGMDLSGSVTLKREGASVKLFANSIFINPATQSKP